MTYNSRVKWRILHGLEISEKLLWIYEETRSPPYLPGPKKVINICILFNSVLLIYFWQTLSLNHYNYKFSFEFEKQLRKSEKSLEFDGCYEVQHLNNEVFGSSRMNPGAMFFLTIAFLLYLAPAVGSNPAGQSLTLN